MYACVLNSKTFSIQKVPGTFLQKMEIRLSEIGINNSAEWRNVHFGLKVSAGDNI